MVKNRMKLCVGVAMLLDVRVSQREERKSTARI